ncbi:MAG: hypothetical protein CMM46_09375 [Rhodospirillaceae bacterium]|nr:hypothetical protein [Rhodospirillaceae bacterium]|tara:strand:+ start:2412 stop:3062 length:651 start_codon:yes stop_codon:yes gene_type:complete
MEATIAQRTNLSHARIVDAAVRLLDTEPGRDLTMRRLAGELGVDPMAIYHYVPSKKALLHAVVGRFLGVCDLPAAGVTWQERAEALCRAFRALAHRHPGPFLIYVMHPEYADNEIALHEAAHAILHDAGFKAAQTVYAARQLLAYPETFAWSELTGRTGDYDDEERADLEAALTTGNFPITRSLVGEITQPDVEDEFAFGLETMILGLEAQLAKTP